MKKLLLINPVAQRSGGLLSRFTTFPPLSLAYVAAVTPADWEVKILDENFDEFKFEEADLVGITAFTTNINRAYEIGKIYRDRNIKVVIGGIHASMVPEEATQYADALVIGEAEGIWGKVISDFENNCLSKKYIGPRVDMEQFKVRPRRDLIHPDYFFQCVQTSRGCPFNCNFCSVTKYLGNEYRQRNPKDVLDELEALKNKYIFFVDDNLVGYSDKQKSNATELFKGMIKRGLNIKWWMQTSINISKDEKILELAAKSGCMFALVGFEAISEQTLKTMKKGVNIDIGVDNFKRAIGSFHKYGIGVVGSFIIGNDHESPSYYKKLAKFVVSSGLDVLHMNILTPLPGTALMKKIKKEERLIYTNFPQDWKKYRLSHLVQNPTGVDKSTVYIGNNLIKKTIYSFPTYQYRMIKSFLSVKSLANFYAILKFNQAQIKGWKNSHYYKEYPLKF